MKLDLISFLIGLVLIPLIFVVRRRTLTETKYLRLLFIIGITLAVIGLLTIPYVKGKPNFYIFLICPLFSLTVFRFLYLWFKRSLKREPEDTFLRWFPEKDLSWDRAFNVAFFVISISLPLFLLAIVYG